MSHCVFQNSSPWCQTMSASKDCTSHKVGDDDTCQIAFPEPQADIALENVLNAVLACQHAPFYRMAYFSGLELTADVAPPSYLQLPRYDTILNSSIRALCDAQPQTYPNYASLATMLQHRKVSAAVVSKQQAPGDANSYMWKVLDPTDSSTQLNMQGLAICVLSPATELYAGTTLSTNPAFNDGYIVVTPLESWYDRTAACKAQRADECATCTTFNPFVGSCTKHVPYRLLLGNKAVKLQHLNEFLLQTSLT